jgi:hypothetical protein
MRSYERIFPKDTKIYLFTTDKYDKSNNRIIKDKWSLKKTKIHIEKYNPLTLPFKLRKFCRKNKIQRIVNLGEGRGGLIMLIASLFRKTNYLLNFTGESLIKYKFKSVPLLKRLNGFFETPIFFLLAQFAKKITFVGYNSYKKAPKFFLKSPKKIVFTHPVANTKLFKLKNKKICRKKLNLPLNKNILI